MISSGQHNTLSRTLVFAGKVQKVMIQKGLTSAQKTCPICEAHGALKFSLSEKDQAFQMKCETVNCINYTERNTK